MSKELCTLQRKGYLLLFKPRALLVAPGTIFGKISVLRNGNDGLILANGIMVGAACQAAEILVKDDIDLTVADLHTVQPLDIEGLLSLVKKQRTVFVA